MSGLVTTLLRACGLNVTTVSEENNLVKSDQEQLELAARCRRCIVTHNRADFERLHIHFLEEEKQHSGIIVIAQKSPYEIAQYIMVSASGLERIIRD